MDEKRAVIYTRVSTEGQADEGTSLAAQEIACRKKAGELGATVVAIHSDPGVSGAFYLSRPGINAAIRDIEDGQAELLIIAKLDRTGRDVDVLRAIQKRVRVAGGRLIFCDGLTFEHNAVGKLMYTQMAGYAEFERELIRERTMSGKRRMAEQGRTPARGRHPFGYRIVTKEDVLTGRYPVGTEGTYQIVEERADWVRQMYERYDQGASLRGLSHWLHAEGVETQNGGNLWHMNTIRDILLNPVNKGKPIYGRREHRGDETRLQAGKKTERYYRAAPKEQWIELDAPAIVDEDLWQRVVARIKTNRSTKSGNPALRRMLTGMIRCKQCGVLMISKTRRQYSYYHCRYYGASCTPKGHVCDRRSYPAQAVEEKVGTRCSVSPPWSTAN